MDRIEYAEPMDRIDPSDRMDRIDRRERRERTESRDFIARSTVAMGSVYHSGRAPRESCPAIRESYFDRASGRADATTDLARCG
ncbi:hypothetical protein FMUBM48_45980 [Nocardia cyriacigeorgica]|nr:hypothetical protein FMUBM48_45980 [Nocardia cyriacigeorgica]